MFRFSKLKLIGLGGLGDGANQIIIVTKTEIDLGGLGMVPVRSLLSQFRLPGILGRTLKVVLPSACPVFS